MKAFAARLPLGALGLSLALLVAGAWGTGFLYLLARFGAGSPVRLAVADGIHVYVGLASAAFLVAKIWRVGFRRRVPGVTRVSLWQRWISWSLVVLYAAIYLTGAAALLPLPARLNSTAVNAHLISSVWAVAPTSWHIWHYRRRAVPHLARLRVGQPGRRWWRALAVLCLPIPLVAAAPRALSALPRAGLGAPVVNAGLDGIYLDRLLPTSDGRLLAGGDGLYITAGDGAWRRVDLPSGGNAEVDRRVELGIRPEAAPAPTPAAGAAGHGAHAAPADPGTILSMAASMGRSAYYVGTTDGLYYSPWPDGPYLALPFPGGPVRDLAIDPENPYELWAACGGGIVGSVDGGHSWAPLGTGLARPASARAIAFFSGRLYASDGAAVYRWEGTAARWVASSSQPWVTSLRAGGGRLYSASQVTGARQFDGRAWSDVDLGSEGHQHGALPRGHLLGVVPAFGHVYPVGSEGSLSAVRDATPFGSELWTAGESGVGRMTVDQARPAGPGWWTALVVIALLTAVLAARMIRSRSKAVTPKGPRRALPLLEVIDVSFQDGGGGSRHRLPGPGLRPEQRRLRHRRLDTGLGALGDNRGRDRQQGR